MKYVFFSIIYACVFDMCVCTYVDILLLRINFHVNVFSQIHICIYASENMYAYVCVHMYVCVCKYVFGYMCLKEKEDNWGEWIVLVVLFP